MRQLKKSLKDWQIEITKVCIEKGFDWKPTLEDINIALLRTITELTEAAEALRDNDMKHFKEELADTFIRLANLCEVTGTDLEEEVTKKHIKNKNRGYLHGKHI